MTSSRNIRSAFTLIELLVVIAIIAILAAILFPVFAQAKEAAKKTVCVSNTKQIALGLYMYAGDSDDTLSQTSWETAATPQPFNNGGYQIHWSYLIQPYVKSWDIFVCPSDSKPVPTDRLCTDGQAGVGKLTGGQLTCDWAAQKNSYIPIYNALPAHDWQAVNLSQFPSPSNQAVVGEHRDDGIAADGHKGTSGFFPSQPCAGWDLVPYPAGGKQYSYFPAAEAKLQYGKVLSGAATAKAQFKKYDVLRVAWDRHSSKAGANYSFADGHAKYQSIDKTLDANAYAFGEKWYPNPEPWGNVCP